MLCLPMRQRYNQIHWQLQLKKALRPKDRRIAQLQRSGGEETTAQGSGALYAIKHGAEQR